MNPGLLRSGSRPLAGALVAFMAAAALVLGAAAGYWARGFAPAPSAPSVTTTSYGQVTTSGTQNEQLRQRLIDANR